MTAPGRRARGWAVAGGLAWLAVGVMDAARADVPDHSGVARRPPDAAWRVGSKTFTESVILGELAAQLAVTAGVHASHRSGLGGTRLLWDALESGAIDAYPEYTGTLIQEILRSDRPADRPASAPAGTSSGDAWLSAALAAHGIGLAGPLGFNNTYAIGVKAELARKMGLRTIGDLRAHAELRFGWSNEFVNRRDGWPALRAAYALPQTNVTGLDHDLAYRGLASGAIDATDLYATDPEIRSQGLRILEDDRHVFPRYDAVLLYRLDSPAAAVAALGQLRGRIDAATMGALNARAKLERVPEPAVAADFLRATFGATAAASPIPPSLVGDVLHRGGEHLLLVALSLLAAIAVAIPLGIVAARRPRAGQLVIGAVGVVQTIPSLALLVFMIPLLGIGARPALAALFLYSLLPIVRNTHAGLRGIPAAVRESAEALGLPPGAILRLVELPLASPLILAGIKSAAVINVGTATLGALIGAGGFGQPIFTGIRLNDVGLILQGAVPASLLALLVQGLFDGIERGIVPRGLRLKRSV